MERECINGNKDDADDDAEEDIDKGDNELFRICPDLCQDGKRLAAALVLELAEWQGHGMTEAVREDGSAEPLDDDLTEIILEGFGNAGDHGHTYEDAQIDQHVVDKLSLGTGTLVLPNFVMRSRVDNKMAFLFWVGGEAVQTQLAKKIGVQHREDLVDGGQEKGQQYHPSIGLEIGKQNFHIIIT